jgi:hypothetical protein
LLLYSSYLPVGVPNWTVKNHQHRAASVMIGYEAGTKAYHAYNPVNKKLVVTRNVLFEEENHGIGAPRNRSNQSLMRYLLLFTVIYMQMIEIQDITSMRIRKTLRLRRHARHQMRRAGAMESKAGTPHRSAAHTLRPEAALRLEARMPQQRKRTTRAQLQKLARPCHARHACHAMHAPLNHVEVH